MEFVTSLNHSQGSISNFDGVGIDPGLNQLEVVHAESLLTMEIVSSTEQTYLSLGVFWILNQWTNTAVDAIKTDKQVLGSKYLSISLNNFIIASSVPHILSLSVRSLLWLSDTGSPHRRRWGSHTWNRRSRSCRQPRPPRCPEPRSCRPRWRRCSQARPGTESSRNLGQEIEDFKQHWMKFFTT